MYTIIIIDSFSKTYKNGVYLNYFIFFSQPVYVYRIVPIVKIIMIYTINN